MSQTLRIKSLCSATNDPARRVSTTTAAGAEAQFFYPGHALSWATFCELSGGTALDVSGYDALALRVSATSANTGAPLMAATAVPGACTPEAWTAGTDAHATFEFTAEETNIDLQGRAARSLWWALFGVDGSVETPLATGWVTAYGTGNSGEPAGNPELYATLAELEAVETTAQAASAALTLAGAGLLGRSGAGTAQRVTVGSEFSLSGNALSLAAGVQASLAAADGAVQPLTLAPACDAVRFPPRILREDAVLSTLSTAGSYAQPSLIRYRGVLLAFAMRDADAQFTNAEVKLWRSTDGGVTWGAEETLALPAADAMTLTGGAARWVNVHPSIIGGKLYLIAQANVGGESSTARNETYLFRTVDLSTFTRVAKFSNEAGAGVSGDAGEVGSSEVIVLEDGTWIFGHYSNTAGTWRSCAMRSTDRGATWTRIVILSAANETVLRRHGVGTVALIRTNTDGELKRAISTDSGVTWSTPAALAVPSTYSSNGAWFHLTEGGEAIGVIRVNGSATRTERIGLFRNVVSGTSSAVAYELPTQAMSFGGSVLPLGDGRYGVLRCSYTLGGSGPNSIRYNEIALHAAETARGLIVPDVTGCDSSGNFSGLVRGAAGFDNALLIWDTEASVNGYEWARGKALTTSGGQYRPSAAQAVGYRRCWEETAASDDILCGVAADWTALHNGVMGYYIALAGYMPNINADCDLFGSNGSSSNYRGVRLFAVNATNQLRLFLTNGDGGAGYTHSVSVLQRSAWFMLVWHVSAVSGNTVTTTLFNGNAQTRSTSVQTGSFTPSASAGNYGLSLCNFRADVSGGFVGLKLTDAVVVQGALSMATVQQLFAWMGRGRQ